MKYMLFLYEDEARFHGLPPDKQMAHVGEHMAYSRALAEAGAMVGGAPLDHSRDGRRVRSQGVENGPFTDAKEQIGGFYVIEAPDLDAALDWAARCPTASIGAVEVRPFWEVPRP